MYIYPILSVAFIVPMFMSIHGNTNILDINGSDLEIPTSIVDIDSTVTEINYFSFNQSPELAITTVSSTPFDKKITTSYEDIDGIIGTIKNLENQSFHFIEIPLAEIKMPARKVDPIDEVLAIVDYWDTVYSIESNQGKFLYRPRNKSRNCTFTTSPCGHHQLSVQALNDIGCKSLQCRKDRLNFDKSLKMSKKLQWKNERRLQKKGFTEFEDYQRYLIHQQGATGIKTIIAASKGKKLLSKRLKKNMAANSPYSYRQLRRMGSKLAARKFMQHWKNTWENEKRIVAGIGIVLVKNDTSSKKSSIPTFNEKDIKLALNYKF